MEIDKGTHEKKPEALTAYWKGQWLAARSESKNSGTTSEHGDVVVDTYSLQQLLWCRLMAGLNQKQGPPSY